MSRARSSGWSMCRRRRRRGRARVVAARAQAEPEHRDCPHQPADASHPVRVRPVLTAMRAETFRLRHDDACVASEVRCGRGPIGNSAVASRESRTATTPRSVACGSGDRSPVRGALRHGGRSISANASAPARSRRACSNGSSGRGNGSRSIVTTTGSVPVRRRPARSPSWRTGSRVLVGEAGDQRRLRAGRPGRGSCARRGRAQLGGRAHRAPRGEERERASAGRLDQRRQLVVQRGLVSRLAGVGQMRRAVEEGVLLVVERTADVEQSVVSRVRRGGSAACGAASRS